MLGLNPPHSFSSACHGFVSWRIVGHGRLPCPCPCRLSCSLSCCCSCPLSWGHPACPDAQARQPRRARHVRGTLRQCDPRATLKTGSRPASFVALPLAFPLLPFRSFNACFFTMARGACASGWLRSVSVIAESISTASQPSSSSRCAPGPFVAGFGRSSARVARRHSLPQAAASSAALLR